MEIVGTRKIRIADLNDGTDHYEMPLSVTESEFANEADVHTLVDHTAKPDSWMRNGSLIRRIVLRGTGQAEMLSINAARETMNGRMAVTLGLVKSAATGENQV